MDAVWGKSQKLKQMSTVQIAQIVENHENFKSPLTFEQNRGKLVLALKPEEC